MSSKLILVLGLITFGLGAPTVYAQATEQSTEPRFKNCENYTPIGTLEVKGCPVTVSVTDLGSAMMEFTDVLSLAGVITNKRTGTRICRYMRPLKRDAKPSVFDCTLAQEL